MEAFSGTCALHRAVAMKPSSTGIQWKGRRRHRLSCGNFGFDRPNVGLNEGFFLVAGDFDIDRDPLEWAERSSLS
jgi:hypothetical protein